MSYWYDDAIFYSIYPLGAVTSKHENDYIQTTGGMERLGDWIGHIAGLGFNAIYFGPLFESKTHGYDTTDYRKVDSRLGTNRQFAALVEKCHAAGLRVVVDGVFNHTGRSFFAFRDLKSNREGSPYREWYRGINFGGDNPFGDGFGYEAWRGHYELPRLNPACSGAREYLLDTARGWIREFDIDGIRLDCADCLDFGFMRDLRRACAEQKPDFWLMGEIIHGDYNRWANPETLHSVTNYECSKGIYSSHNDGNMHEIAYSLNRQFGERGIYKGLSLYNFADNHDLNRIADTVSRPEYLPTVYTLLFTMPGVPSVYYGSEWGIHGVSDRVTDWNLRPEIDIKNVRFDDPLLMEHIRLLAAARSRSAALRYGDYTQLCVSARQLAFRRRAGDDEAIVLINASDKRELITIDAAGDTLADMLTGELFRLTAGRAAIAVPAFGSRVLARPEERQISAPPTLTGPEPVPEPESEPEPVTVPVAEPVAPPIAEPIAPVPPPAPTVRADNPAAADIIVRSAGELEAAHVAKHPVFEHDRQDFVTTPRVKVSVYELAPGKSAYPYHWHTAREEVYYILEGSGLLRAPGGDKQVKAGDLIYFPPSEKGAHRLINTTHEPLRYIDFDAMVQGDVAFYPDSRKVNHAGVIHKLGDRVDYYHGE